MKDEITGINSINELVRIATESTKNAKMLEKILRFENLDEVGNIVNHMIESYAQISAHDSSDLGSLRNDAVCAVVNALNSYSKEHVVQDKYIVKYELIDGYIFVR